MEGRGKETKVEKVSSRKQQIKLKNQPKWRSKKYDIKVSAVPSEAD